MIGQWRFACQGGMCMSTSLPLLTSTECSHQEIETINPLSAEQEETLLAAARMGDEDACSTLLLSLAGYVRYWALRYARAFGWASACLREEDLISVGNCTLVETLVNALSKEKPLAY